MRWVFYSVFEDPWLDGTSLKVRFSNLFDLAENKRATVAEMNKLGWRRTTRHGSGV